MRIDIKEGVPLAGHSTMRLGGAAAFLTEVSDRPELFEAITWADEKGIPAIMIGSGSNIVWSDKGFRGLVIISKIMRLETFEENQADVYLTIGSGENWDQVVEKSVSAGLSGIEALSLIPGSAGATPVQNVGAYGQEISETLVSVEAYDRQSKSFVNIPKLDCGFGYRTSRFKTTDKTRFFISAITLHLTRSKMTPPFYSSLQDYMTAHSISDYSPKHVREAVIAIRTSKMPDTSETANNGSFFANPIIDVSEFIQIKADHPDIVYWEMDDGTYKLSAAWLIQEAGFKNFHDQETGMATWPLQPLVIINEHAKSTLDLLKFKQKIVDGVKATFSVTLEQEPEFVGDV